MPSQEELQDRALAWIKDKWQGGELPCAVCGHREWAVGGVVALKHYPEDLLNVGAIVPVVPVVCQTCGNTMLLNAVMAGLFPPSQR